MLPYTQHSVTLALAIASLFTPVNASHAGEIYDFEAPAYSVGFVPEAPFVVQAPRAEGGVFIEDITAFSSEVLGTGDQAANLRLESSDYHPPALSLPVEEIPEGGLHIQADFYIPASHWTTQNTPSLAIEGEANGEKVVGYRVRFTGPQATRINLNDGDFVTNRRIAPNKWIRITVFVAKGNGKEASITISDQEGEIGRFGGRPFQTNLDRITNVKFMDNSGKGVTGSFFIDNIQVSGADDS